MKDALEKYSPHWGLDQVSGKGLYRVCLGWVFLGFGLLPKELKKKKKKKRCMCVGAHTDL